MREFIKRSVERGVPEKDIIQTLDKAVPVEKINQITGEKSLLRVLDKTSIATDPTDTVLKTVIRTGSPLF